MAMTALHRWVRTTAKRPALRYGFVLLRLLALGPRGICNYLRLRREKGRGDAPMGEAWYRRQKLSAAQAQWLVRQTGVALWDGGPGPHCLRLPSGAAILIGTGVTPEPTALARLAWVLADSGADVAYGDEMRVTADEWQLWARGAFSQDEFLFRPDLGGIVAVSPKVADALSLTAESQLSGELVLHAVARAERVAHVAEVLGVCRDLQPCAPATLAHVRAFLAERHPGAFEVTATDAGFDLRPIFPRPAKAAILIPTKNYGAVLKTAVESIERTCDPASYQLIVVDHESDQPETLAYLESLKHRHTVVRYSGVFNFSAINNFALRHADPECSVVILMNNDVEVITPDWLPRLCETALRPDVGAVGPLLLYPDTRVQHAGIAIGLLAVCDHIEKLAATRTAEGQREAGYLGQWLVGNRDVSAITGACLAVRRALYERLGGLDESLEVGCNDIDLCLRLKDLGLKVIFDGRVEIVHHESLSRGTSAQDPHPIDTLLFCLKNRRRLTRLDPFFPPLLSRGFARVRPWGDLKGELKPVVQVVDTPGRAPIQAP